jgi:2-C-methyl-D-erythritol 4-phosphate cytidylyltransferase/2-C-methyl-D-erythritol 2,4-cyclodiphosphate synthase
MKKIHDLGIVIVAGGSSTRFGSGNKLFADLGGVPVFIHSVRAFAPLTEPGQTVLVVPSGETDRFRRALEVFAPECGVRLVPGGAVRTESVKNGLRALSPETGIAAIHDAARPLAPQELLLELVETAEKFHCGAIAAERIVDSVCRTDSDGRITENVPREDLRRIQTPQVFPYAEICACYEELGDTVLTDDSAAFRACGREVVVVENPLCNLKLTTRADLDLLRFEYAARTDLPKPPQIASKPLKK